MQRRSATARAGIRTLRVLLAVQLLVCFLWPAVVTADTQPGATNNPGPVISTRIELPIVDADDLRFGRLSTAQGLSQTRVQQIVQDDQGFLWFGTQYGLNRYDGYTFKVFVHDTARANSLSGVYIFSVFKDRAGYLWVGSDEALDRFDPRTEVFTHYKLQRPGSDHGDATVGHIAQDEAGSIWLATGSGLFRLEPATGRTTLFQHHANDPASLASSDVKSSLEDRHHRFWVANGNGLDQLDRGTGKVRLHVPIANPIREFRLFEADDGVLWLGYASGRGAGLASYDPDSQVLTDYVFSGQDVAGTAFTGIYAITRDRAGALWFGTGGLGLLRLDRANRRFIRYRNVADDPESISEDHITSLLQDRQGNLWVGLHSTGPNFLSLGQKPFQQVVRTLGPSAGGERLINSIFEDRDGLLWVGSSGGLSRIDRASGASRFFATARGTVSAGVVAIARSPGGELWLGTVGQGLKRFNPTTGSLKTYVHDSANPNSLSDDVVADLRFDGPDTLWVSTWSGLNRLDTVHETFTVYKADPRRQTNRFGRMAQDRQGTLWLAGDPGLTHFDPRTAAFTVAKHSDSEPTISSDAVTFVFVDSDGGLWVGTRNGLDRQNADGTFRAFQQKDGLGGNSVSCILEDDAAHLWISTNKGLSKLDRRTLTFTNYSAADGLGDLTGWNSCARAAGGQLLFGGFSGLIAFDPARVNASYSDAPIRLTDLRIDGRTVPVGTDSILTAVINFTNNITLPADHRNFSLEFASLSFASPGSIRYRYRMDGLDVRWNEGGSDRRSVSYSGLPPGTYTFRGQAAVDSAPWTEPGAVLRIRILPPWWSTWWFRIAALLTAIALATWLYQLRLRQIAKSVTLRMNERMAERTRIAQDLHDTVLQGLLSVSMQMAVVNRKLPDSVPVKADYATLLQTLRQVADESRNAVRGLRELAARSESPAQAIARIPEDLATDPATRLTVHVEGEPRPLQAHVQQELYLISREAIANAFRHASATGIAVVMRYSAGGLGVSITDDGVGMETELAEAGLDGHFGLRGMRERATRIGATLRISGTPGKGTVIQLLIPASVAFQRRQAWLGRFLFASSDVK